MNTMLDMAQVLGTAYEVADFINRSQVMADYLARKREMHSDADACRLIRDFQRVKEAYEEAQRFGKYHPDYRRIMKEVRVRKREMDLHPSIANYKRAEKRLEELLYHVAKTIAHSVSETIKVPSDNPLLGGFGCGSGGCGSGGCGCRM
ncbi:regulatory iron-sulfur-containing complex subunit RicF [Bacillaceae bacterium]